jgi:hypothetical protein
VKTAFLNGELNEEVFMEQPEGFIESGKEDQVCLLKKSLYGLKQAPRMWNIKFNQFLIRFGLKRSELDSCVYFRRNGTDLLIIAIFVDDGLVCASNIQLAKSVIDSLSEEFDMRSLPATRFLGLDLHLRSHKILINQPEFIKKVLNKFNMGSCKPTSIPMDPGTRLTSSMTPTSEEEIFYMAKVPYREAVGCLLYISITCRPDISYAVSQVAKFCQNPGRAHWSAVKKILAYLSGTTELGILFEKNETNPISGYTDADYGGDLDNRCSTSGSVFFVYGNLVSWSSKRQKCISQSTTEAEYVAASDACKEAVWLSSLLTELGETEEKSVPMYCDNQSAIQSIRNPAFHQRTKHIDVRYHFIRSLQENGIIDVSYVPSKEQKADILTKPLPKPEFKRMCQQLGLCDITMSVEDSLA